MKLTVSDEILSQGSKAIRSAFVDRAVQFSLNAGVLPEHAKKWSVLFAGMRALLKLHTPVCHLVDITGYAKSAGLEIGRVSGYLPFQPGGINPPYLVHADPDAEQHLFLISVERIDSLTTDGSIRSWMYYLVLLETTTEMPLVIGLDLVCNDPEGLEEEDSYRFRPAKAFQKWAGETLPPDADNLMNTSVNAVLADEVPINDNRVVNRRHHRGDLDE